MRLRVVALASLLFAFAGGIVPAVGTAAPRHNHGLTINAAPRHIQAGEDVLIYGHLKGGNVANQSIVLYQHVAGSGHGYTLVSNTTTDSTGLYEFTESDVASNRSWFTRGPDGSHSRTVFERVQALVTPPSTTSSTVTTNHRVVFTGSVTPPIHAFERVLLQQQIEGTDDWRTIDSGRLDRASHYSIAHRFRFSGERDLRVVFPGDARNARGFSDSTELTVDQAQVQGFTIDSSPHIIPYGGQATISGVLDQPGTTTPEPNTAVVLCGRTVTAAKFTCSQVTTTGADGRYSFTVSPPQNELYQVRTSLPPRRHTAVLFEGVKDAVTFAPSSNTSTVGGTVTFTGNVTPDKAGHVIYLQRLGRDGDWHTVEVTRVHHDSSYQFSWTFATPGEKRFRARIPSDRHNLGAASDPVTINVTPGSASALPPAT